MADVTLRAYVKEIDDLIERDQLDEAIAHCRHILQIYPKHLETYRALGKAYLEAKRFGDAADIFQRVLSAVPEDFVSHIGMGIVREDEGNLDAAIWHMERAFEANPANPAIRQELSRLIGRRDGLEPHKIRLTRGALARQYAQGELYAQAIAELRSALQEDPEREDLEILLATMYWRSEQFDAAKTICKQILEKLPYSFQANRIMAAIYQATNNPEKASEYHRRLAALDPYMAFVDSAATDPGSISASAVRIEHSDWLPGQPLPTAEGAEPGWVSSLGIDLSEDDGLPDVDSVPSWMSELEGEVRTRPETPDAFSPDEPDDALSEAADIPEWMREAGWEPSAGEVEEAPVSFSDEELDALDSGGPMPKPEEERGEEEEIAPADIPDWLQDIAPAEIPSDPEPEPEPGDKTDDKKEFVPDWLADISSEADDVPPEPVEDTQEVKTPEAERPGSPPAVVDPDDEDQPEVPTWVEDQAPGATSTIISWLGDRPASGPGAELADEPAATIPEGAPPEEADDEIPSWLDELDDEEEAPLPTAESAEDEEVPSWLAGVADAASDIDLDFDQEQSAAEVPEPTLETPEPGAPLDSEQAADEDAWLRDLAVSDLDQDQQVESERPDQGPEEELPEPVASDEVPDWLQGIAETPEGGLPEAEPEEEPDWLRGLDIEEEQAEEPARPAPRQEVPEWLQGIADPSAAGEITTPETELPGTEEEVEPPPDWLEDYSDGDAEAVEEELDLDSLREFEAEVSSEPEQFEAPSTRAPEEIGVGEDLDDEEVYQWLESLAREQEEEPGSERPVTEGIGDQQSPIIEDALPPEEPEASLDWLEDLASERGLDVDVAAQEDASQIETPEPESEVPDVEPEPEEDQEEAPDWLREMAARPTDETVIAQRPAEFTTEPVEPEPAEPEIPGWLDEATSIAAEVPAEPAGAEAQPAIEETEATPPKEVVEQPTPPEVVEPEVEPTELERQEPRPPEPEAVEPEVVEPEPAEVETAEVVPETPSEVPDTPPEAIEEAPPEPEPVKMTEVPTETEAALPSSEPETPAAEPESEEAPPKFKEPLTEPTQLLQSARQALGAGDAGRALSDYLKLIDRDEDLETVIKDLQRASERYPNLPKVWQALGDAYMKADQLPEAIKAYKRGMEVA